MSSTGRTTGGASRDVGAVLRGGTVTVDLACPRHEVYNADEPVRPSEETR